MSVIIRKAVKFDAIGLQLLNEKFNAEIMYRKRR